MVIDGKFSQEYPVNTESLKAPFLVVHFSCQFINGLPDDVICNIAIYADDTTLYSKFDHASDLWQQLQLPSELESDLWDTVDWSRKRLVDFNAEKTHFSNLFHFNGLTTLVLLMLKWIGLFLRKNHLWRCWSWFCLLNWIGALTLALLVKLPPGKLESWFILWSFFLKRLVCISIYIRYGFCMEYCCHVWAGAPSC